MVAGQGTAEPGARFVMENCGFNAAQLKEEIRLQVLAQGFQAIGFAPAVPADGFDRLNQWIDAGAHAGMAYMEQQAPARRHPESILKSVKSVIMVSMLYRCHEVDSPLEGRVARYARGPDYHDVLWKRLGTVLAWMRGRCPDMEGRVVADTAPLLERDFARRAGLGWIGKNTLLINQSHGSFTVLGAILVNLDLPSDPPFEADRCGSCTACLDACPTGALGPPRWLDAGKCISYWNIEHRGAAPDWVPESLEGWLFGCDICQEVCPWNRKLSAGAGILGADPDLLAIDPRKLLRDDDDALRMRFRKTALWRARPEGLRRNALWVIGGQSLMEDSDLVSQFLEHADAGVRSAARWAINQITKSNR